jgi:hypothetical protein
MKALSAHVRKTKHSSPTTDRDSPIELSFFVIATIGNLALWFRADGKLL